MVHDIYGYPTYHGITYSTAMTAVEHKSDFELTKDPVSRASYGVLLWGSEVNYIVINLRIVYEYL